MIHVWSARPWQRPRNLPRLRRKAMPRFLSAVDAIRVSIVLKEENKRERERKWIESKTYIIWIFRPDTHRHRIFPNMDVHKPCFFKPFFKVSPRTCRIPCFLISLYNFCVVLLKSRAPKSSILRPDPCIPVLKLYLAPGLSASNCHISGSLAGKLDKCLTCSIPVSPSWNSWSSGLDTGHG